MTSNLPISMTSRWISLACALGVFALLYSLTNIYAQTLFYDTQFYATQLSKLSSINPIWPRKVHILAIPIDAAIPFVALMIVPYSWSIMLFCASFFMVKPPAQLSLLTRKLILATLFACFIFYVFPAKFTFERPTVLGWTHYGYQFLHITDKPFNQFPSLHVTYAVLLGTSLWQLSKSALYRLTLCCICSLIIISTVLTYQHHLLDIAGGLLLATLILVITNKLRNNLVLKYLTVAISGFLILSIAGFMLNRSMTSITFAGLYRLVATYWMLSFFVLAWAYQYPNQPRDKRWFAKDEQGRLLLSTWLTFAPLLLGYRLMWYVGQRYQLTQHTKSDFGSLNHTDRCPTHKIVDSVYAVATPTLFGLSKMSDEHYSYFSNFAMIIVIDSAVETNSHSLSLKQALHTHHTYAQAQRLGAGHLDVSNLEVNHDDSLSCDFHPSFAAVQMRYLYFPLLDLQSLGEIDTQHFVHLFKQIDALAAIDIATNITKKKLPSKTILINFQCVMGLSRSVALHALYLIYRGQLTIDNYVAWINEQYPKAHVNDNYLPKSLIDKVRDLAKNT
ncbi:phosphatase PAP2 family protein [Psychrobacter sp. PAMC 21119]|uniref:phosphatase PAP2 family protein n=1 Tax=Psychrobacter sp. PAMC 21119 TaxID=1112209 RepID=UPI0002886B12|nr:phosphatase PAP2 family protein [Psychrobacter sp. PAMC 21119]